MKIRVESRSFAEQVQAHAFRFCCEDCAFFSARADRCAHGWPTREHRSKRYRSSDLTEVVFCKEFELR